MLFTETVKDNKIYLRCFRQGSFVSCGFATVYYLKNKLPVNRFGISVSKKTAALWRETASSAFSERATA